MKNLEWCQWRCSGEHIFHFVLIADSGQANVFWDHIEKTNIFEDMIGYIMLYLCCSILNLNKI